MAGPWQNYPQSFGVYPSYYTTSQNAPDFTPTAGFYGNVLPFQQPVLERLHTGIPEFEDLSRPVIPPQASNRIRRRVNAGGEHVKFRRTRSGCYTCRNRRVKCDETRPICERCRKGNRDCVYPEPASNTKARRDSNKSRSAKEGDGSSPDAGEFEDLIHEDDDAPTSAIDEPDSATSNEGPIVELRASSDPPHHAPVVSPSSSSDGPNALTRAQTSTPVGQSSRSNSRPRAIAELKIQELPEDIRFYLQYASTKMSHHHWGVRLDHQHFFRRTMIELALRYDPLLYAFVGFAAYHCTIEKPDGVLRDFLGYYQKSVTLLRQTFKQKPTIATILTILQLATIEEYLGDWVNLMNHQTAALTLITTLYTPEKMCAHESLRKVFQWYARFDVFVGILSGAASQLGREWFASQLDFYQKQCEEHPESLTWKYEERYAWARLTGFDLRAFMRKKALGELSEEDFTKQLAVFEDQVENIYTNIHPMLRDDSKRLEDISEGRTKSPDDIVDPYEPNVLYGGELFDTNLVIHDMISFEMLYKNMIASTTGKFDLGEIRATCLRECQLYKAVTLYSGSPPGIRFGMQAGLALCILFLRANEKEIWWARKQFAEIEAKGYTYPVGLRTRLETLWGLDLSNWWLPGEQPRLVKQIREFVRSEPSGDKETSLYELRGIFTALQLENASSPDSLTGTSPLISERPGIGRASSARSMAAFSSAHSDDAQFDFDMLAAHDRNQALGESPDFEWT
ncbi:uncharacterized protein PV09_03219 [Verruconis gallopava]|uniref:Zn(2)-C6 fungal-type domain-containing protein n=1 Tax=Verruconis gallopava TaxID=253628 RepID=A0A0D2AGK8_9PEZI|nr:uncharacterized protein PV09_03219 [Verruconis gallopava]KIW06043.1 hypothetical protein PV09_03219 [Verruconis gallopava]